MELVATRPRAVGELAQVLPITRPAVSQHLKLLKTAGLVTDRAEGTRRIYRASPEGLRDLRAQLDRFSPPAQLVDRSQDRALPSTRPPWPD